MPLIARQRGVDLPPIPSGAYTAVCTTVADIGMSRPGRYKPQPKVYVGFELIGERVSIERDGQKVSVPRMIGKFYTLSLSRKARLRSDLESWRGRLFTDQELKGFDLFTVAGAPCQIGVVHERGDDGKTYVNIGSIMGLPRGMARPTPESPLLKYSPDEPGDFDRLPPWLQDRIRDGEQRAAELGQTPSASPPPGDAEAPEFDDDIPF